MLFCSLLCSGFGEKDLGDIPSSWLCWWVWLWHASCFKTLCAVCKIVQNFKLLIFPFTCVFILLCMGIFPLKQMNLLINDVTFHSAVISQITAAGPPFCDLSNFMCLHSRCLFMVCFWTIIGWGCFYTFYYYCTFLQILSGLFSFQFFLNKGLYCDICLHCKLLKSIIFEEH